MMHSSILIAMQDCRGHCVRYSMDVVPSLLGSTLSTPDGDQSSEYMYRAASVYVYGGPSMHESAQLTNVIACLRNVTLS